MTNKLIPVRKMHDDGYITVRYINEDGTEPDELPEEYTLGATLHLHTEIWDEQYRLLGRRNSYLGQANAVTNLRYLSDTNPLVFEEVLVYIETHQGEGMQFFRHVMDRKKMVPTERNPDATYHDMYKALMEHGDLLMELGKEYAVDMECHYANMMFNDARKIMDGFDSPLFAAASVAAWLIHRGTGKRAKITYEGHAEDINYIATRLDDVVNARYDLKRLRSIKRADIESMLASPLPLRDGSL